MRTLFTTHLQCGIFPDSPIDPRLDRCDYFVIVDTTDMSFEVVENQSAALSQGAGIRAQPFLFDYRQCNS